MRTIAWWCLPFFLVACDPADPVDADPQDMDASVGCEGDADCSDGLYCNGVERCVEGSCVPGASPCGARACDEDAGRCSELTCDTDEDGDGAIAVVCGGSDCDDDDPLRHEGATEICDPDHRDEDCDPSTFGDEDADGDGAIAAHCCNMGPSGLVCGTDCDDDDPGVHPRATEVCDGRDNDCDGRVDEEVLIESWPDADGDGWGDASASSVLSCVVPPGNVTRAGDCDDSDASVHPDAEDVCDGVDQDCDGRIDESACGAGAECVVPVDGSTPSCRVLRCAPTSHDCNGSAADGCEEDLCTSSTSCGSCGTTCACLSGTCTVSSPHLYIATVRNAATRAPVAGAVAEPRGRCAAAATSDVDGSLSWISYGAGGTHIQVRVEAPGYLPTVSVPANGEDILLFTTADIEAWRVAATSPWTDAPFHGALVIDLSGFSVPDVNPPYVQITGVPHGEPVVVEDGGENVRLLVPNVAPGTLEIRTLAPWGCSLRCDGVRPPFYLDAGAIGHLSLTDCSLACS